LVLQRSSRGHRLRLSRADRFLWVWLARFWSAWRSALVIVKPETVIAWHRKGFRLYWKWKSRHPEGRPSVSLEVIELIHRMSLANPRWGAPRIHGELLKLGFELSQATVAKYLVRHRRGRRRRIGARFSRTTCTAWSRPISSWFPRSRSGFCLFL
jgi:hypothetical protein